MTQTLRNLWAQMKEKSMEKERIVALAEDRHSCRNDWAQDVPGEDLPSNVKFSRGGGC